MASGVLREEDIIYYQIIPPAVEARNCLRRSIRKKVILKEDQEREVRKGGKGGE